MTLALWNALGHVLLTLVLFGASSVVIWRVTRPDYDELDDPLMLPVSVGAFLLPLITLVSAFATWVYLGKVFFR